MAVLCPKCAAELTSDARFCHVCGTKVTDSRRAHSRYMSVLFCDLTDSTGLTSKLGDETMFDIVSRYQSLCNQVVAEHGGFVAKYMGDGMLAYFGYPETLKNSAEPAVRAAHNIIEATRGIAPPGESLSANAGVATGWMVVAGANTGTASAEMMAIGGTVNLAARLQAEARNGQIAISTETSQRLDPGQFSLVPLGTRKLRGFSNPVDVWTAEASGNGRQRNVFVDRVRLREALTSSWEVVQSGQNAAVVLTGPGGYGKTSLAEHFLSNHLDESDIFVVRGQAHHREQSFRAFSGFIRRMAGLSDTDDPDAQRAALAKWSPPGMGPGLEVLCQLNAVPVPPLLRTQMIEQALRATFQAQLPQRPCALFVEDSHWIDTDSLAFIGTLPSSVSNSGLMILAARRPEGPPFPIADAQEIRLGRLDDDEVEAVITALDLSETLDPSARKEIVTRAGGVPLFVQQITRAVLERKTHATADGIPPSMVEALLERIGNLDDKLGLVEAAATLGTAVRVDVLSQMVGATQDEVAQNLAGLVERGLFRPGSDGSIQFDHALIRDAVIETILAADQQKLHARALEAYEAAAPERLTSSPVTNATHLMGSGRVIEAIPQLILAGQAALGRGEIAEAVRLLRWAEGKLEEVPTDGGLRDQLELPLRFTLGLSLTQHRGFSDPTVAEAYGRALELCRESKVGGETEFQIAWGIWAHYMVIGDVKGTTAMSHRMNEIAALEPPLEVLAKSVDVLVSGNRGDLEKQEAAYAETARLYVPELHRLHAVTYTMDSLEMATLFRVHGRWIAGDLPGWQKAFDFSRAHEDALQLPFLRPYIHVYSTAPNTYAHSDKPYREEIENAVAYANEVGQPFWVISGNMWLAQEAVRNAPIEEATDAMEAASAGMKAIGIKLGWAYHLGTLASCYAQVGQIAKAQRTIEEALGELENGRDLLYGPEVQRLRAEIAMRGDGDSRGRAQEYLSQAQELATRMGAWGWAALIAGSQARLDTLSMDQTLAQAKLESRLSALIVPGSENHPAFLTARRALEIAF